MTSATAPLERKPLATARGRAGREGFSPKRLAPRSLPSHALYRVIVGRRLGSYQNPFGLEPGFLGEAAMTRCNGRPRASCETGQIAGKERRPAEEPRRGSPFGTATARKHLPEGAERRSRSPSGEPKRASRRGAQPVSRPRWNQHPGLSTEPTKLPRPRRPAMARPFRHSPAHRRHPFPAAASRQDRYESFPCSAYSPAVNPAGLLHGYQLKIVGSQVDRPVWEHTLYLTLFVTTSGGW